MRLPAEKFSINAYQWFQGTPNRALNQAYKAAIAIQNIEAEYFNGNKIGSDPTQNSSVNSYFAIKLNKLLRTMRWRLAEFRVASVIVSDSDKLLQPRNPVSTLVRIPEAPEPSFNPQDILDKLTVVDQILTRYSEPEPIPVPEEIPNHQAAAAPKDSMFTKTSLIPRSLIKTGMRLNRELKPSSESEVIKEYHLSRFRTRRSFQFLAILIIAPILTQQVSKNFIFSPILHFFHSTKQIEVSLNSQEQSEAIAEIELFEKQFKFAQVINKSPQLSTQEYQAMMEEKTMEIARSHSQNSFSALSNIFSDLLSAAVFAWILITNSENVRILKSFIDELIYGLSDSAKAFVIILFTDVFVGFHSSHGWEIAIEAFLRHFGLPENRDFIFLFIAVFPVTLDSLFKYWIFRYLSRISPSAVATYRNMNE
jgi:hypothetical protein